MEKGERNFTGTLDRNMYREHVTEIRNTASFPQKVVNFLMKVFTSHCRNRGNSLFSKVFPFGRLMQSKLF